MRLLVRASSGREQKPFGHIAILIANIVITSKALVTSSDALVPSSLWFLMQVCCFDRDHTLVAMADGLQPSRDDRWPST